MSIGLFLQCTLIWSPALFATQHSPDAQTGPVPFPAYKPSTRSPQPLDIRANAYGASPSAPNALRIGDIVEDFSARRAGGGLVSLRALRKNGPVVIIFYRGHWRLACNVQLGELQHQYPRFQRRNTNIIALSVDPADDSIAMLKRLGLRYPLASDPNQRIIQKFGVQNPDTRELALHAVYIVDQQGGGAAGPGT